MSDVRSSLSIKKSIKDRLEDLDFVKKKHSFENVIEILMDFYEKNKLAPKKWKKKK